jgi:hypothetical protein
MECATHVSESVFSDPEYLTDLHVNLPQMQISCRKANTLQTSSCKKSETVCFITLHLIIHIQTHPRKND